MHLKLPIVKLLYRHLKKQVTTCPHVRPKFKRIDFEAKPETHKGWNV